MGDRTWVRLTILKSQEEAASSILAEGPETEEEEAYLITYEFSEVNYGNLGFEEKLQQAGIAYDKGWGDGNEYSSGTECCRFDESGELLVNEVYDEQINPDINDLMERIDDPVELRKYILDHKKSTTFTPLNDTQIEYGKRYLARKLIESQ